jgi:hypothetical protein
MSWPRPVTETRLLSWGSSASQGLIKQRRCRACWVSVIPLCRWPMECAEAPPTSTLRFLRRRPSPILANQRISLLRLWLPYRVSPIHHHERPVFTAGEPTHKTPRPPLPRFCPRQRFPSRAEPHTPDGSHTAGYVAPSGFLTLSTLCSPRDLPGLFHPGPALGVRPSRPSSSRDAVRHL